MENLSFDFENKFIYSHKNDFETKDKEIDFLFEVGIFLFWVSTENGLITGIDGTRREELVSWGDSYGEDEVNPYIISDEAFAIHENDAKILNTEKYKEKIQKLVDKHK